MLNETEFIPQSTAIDSRLILNNVLETNGGVYTCLAYTSPHTILTTDFILTLYGKVIITICTIS